ncbi:NUDIX hydrolase [Arthrobacter sp. AQ5-06]|nr:NUDIX hydrolase [Arthrobacter sp. AQ5-06]
MSHKITQVAERLVYENGFIKLYDDDVRFPDGTGRYLRLDATFPGNAVVLVPTYEDLIGLVRTFRYPIGKLAWELPRGFSHGEIVEDTARNELQEELGIDGAEFEVLGFLTPDSGLQSARVAVVAAKVGDKGHGPDDSVEVDLVKWVDVTELERMIREGVIEDSLTIAAYALSRLLASVPGQANSDLTGYDGR